MALEIHMEKNVIKKSPIQLRVEKKIKHDYLSSMMTWKNQFID